MFLILAHIVLAGLLFRFINWLGEHATDFGYSSTTLFEEPRESLALNFFIRALAPAIFMVALSAAAVAAGQEQLRIGIYWVAVFYYALRAIYIFAANMQRLVSWPRYFFHSGIGLGFAWLAYRSLILPNRSLLPNLDTAGNELWLAIFAFLYAAANKVTSSGGPGDRRRNAFIKHSFDKAHQDYGALIDAKISDDLLELITYAILVYENYCRPPCVRTLERWWFWKNQRTTGVMQVASPKTLTDEESVRLGTDKLIATWQMHATVDRWNRTLMVIDDYNLDSVYRERVLEVMDILAKRVVPRFRSAYDSMLT